MFTELMPLIRSLKGMVVITVARVSDSHLRVSLHPHADDDADKPDLVPIAFEGTPAELDASGIDFTPAVEESKPVNAQIQASAASGKASTAPSKAPAKSTTKTTAPAKNPAPAKSPAPGKAPAKAAVKQPVKTAAEIAEEKAAADKAKQDAEAKAQAEAQAKARAEQKAKRDAELAKLRENLAKLEAESEELPLTGEQPAGGS